MNMTYPPLHLEQSESGRAANKTERGALHFDYRSPIIDRISSRPQGDSSQQFSRLFEIVENTRDFRKGYVLGITSTVPGEGKTGLVINLAKHISSHSKLRVL